MKRNSGESSNSQNTQLSRLCKPDFKISQTLPQNSMEFHYGRTGKQSLGKMTLLEPPKESLLKSDVHGFSDSVLCVGGHTAIANETWRTKISQVWHPTDSPNDWGLHLDQQRQRRRARPRSGQKQTQKAATKVEKAHPQVPRDGSG